jgi:hypothetical protein
MRNTELSDFVDTDKCKGIIDLEDYYVAWGFNTDLTVGTFSNSTKGSPCNYLRGKPDSELSVLPENLDSIEFEIKLFESLNFEIGALLMYIYTFSKLLWI